MDEGRSLLVRGIGALVTCDPARGDGPLGIVPRAAVLCRGDRIAYAGPADQLPDLGSEDPFTVDVDGCLVTPGLVDCHTHLVFAGDRLDDYAARLAGQSYGEIAARGGGILSTVDATRAASDELLDDLLQARVERALACGVTTVEVKSGYGLSTAHELRLLRSVQRVGQRTVAELLPTFLGAHALPREARGDAAARRRYIDSLVSDAIPAVAQDRLARFCDAFIDDSALTDAEARRVLQAARDRGLGVKVHADQLSRRGGAALAAELGAVSADHLEFADDADLRALADAGVVGVLLPGASYFLRAPTTDARRLVDAGVRVAVATDCNPGSSPTLNLPLAGQMAVLHSHLTLDGALLGITSIAAAALGLADDRGRVAAGMRADLALFRCRDPRELFYEFGTSLCSGVVKDGEFRRVEAARVSRLVARA